MPTSLSVGTRWYKCDLHLHTPASKCFKDQSVTPGMWVQAAIDAGLTCVAVTDHNTGAWIDDIKTAAGDRLVVFPGVEITCSEAKVHLLVLFDREKGKQDIDDFLLHAGIDRADFSQDTAHANRTLEEVTDLAISKGGLVIPAHIDEFNGLCEPGLTIVKKFLKQRTVLGVQVVHSCFLTEQNDYLAGKQDFLDKLNRYYGVPESKIAAHEYKYTQEKMRESRNAVLEAGKAKKAVLTFSDNPHGPNETKHGLWGIGKRYTWIKMDGTPTLESLRQALLMHQVRTRNDFTIAEGTAPRQYPDMWFKRIIVCNTVLSDPRSPQASVEFSPQMNTIIGGRGSGKSSLLQFVRGVFNRGDDLKGLEAIETDYKNFFKPKNNKATKSGVLSPGCVLEVEVVRKNTLYKIVFTQLTSDAKSTRTELFRFDLTNQVFVAEKAVEIGALFDFDIFSQKQIYEIALSPNSLRTRIDEADGRVASAVSHLGQFKKAYIEQSATLRAMDTQLQGSTKLEVEIRDLEAKIERYRQSPIGELVKQFEALNSERNALTAYINSLRKAPADFEKLANLVVVPTLRLSAFTAESQALFRAVVEQTNEGLGEIAQRLTSIKADYETIVLDVEAQINDSVWSIRLADVERELATEREALRADGLDNYGIDIDISRLTGLKQEKARLAELAQSKVVELAKREGIRKEYVAQRFELTRFRQDYLSSILTDGMVKVEVKQCADVDSMEGQLRTIIGADSGFEPEFEALVDRWKLVAPEKSNDGLRETFHKLIANKEKTDDFSKPFVNRLTKLNGEQIDELDLFFPEDDIRISYGKKGHSIPLSNASAGQKTAAILTILLSQGERPLLMDQPEDDLDAGLISDLVVNRLHEAKQQRQIIVVTHNPNIPVNGDSEYIIVMDAEKKHLTVKTAGCLENQPVKEEICRIMEGGVDAFAMRAERYQFMS